VVNVLEASIEVVVAEDEVRVEGTVVEEIEAGVVIETKPTRISTPVI